MPLRVRRRLLKNVNRSGRGADPGSGATINAERRLFATDLRMRYVWYQQLTRGPGGKVPLTKLGDLNAGWGVCGFTSSFYGLWDILDQSKRSQIHGGTKAHRLLAEIKTYLMMLKAEGSTELLNEIEAFCRKFGDTDNDFGNFSIDSYIARVNVSVNRTEKQIKEDSNFGIGMPPQAVADYLSRMWNVKTEIKTGKTTSGPENGVIGVKNVVKPLSTLYDGLEHYMYRHQQIIYSWGMAFNSVDEAAKLGTTGKWEICCVIPLTSS